VLSRARNHHNVSSLAAKALVEVAPLLMFLSLSCLVRTLHVSVCCVRACARARTCVCVCASTYILLLPSRCARVRARGMATDFGVEGLTGQEELAAKR
jgi:hypothetical protein